MELTPTTRQDWREEFIKRPRTPRIDTKNKDIESLLLRAIKVQVSLQQKQNQSVLVLKLPVSTHQLPKDAQAIYSQLGIGIEGFFHEVLWKKPTKGSSTLWSELVRATYKAYREAWLHLLESLYLDHFHPAADKILREQLSTLRRTTARSPGRRHILAAEKLSLKRRYKELLGDCTTMHEMVLDCVRKSYSEGKIRETIFKEIRGKRFDEDVLPKECGAWDNIPYGGRSQFPRLHDPNSWKPNQLAIALLALERGVKYQTIEKKIAFTRHPTEYR